MHLKLYEKQQFKKKRNPLLISQEIKLLIKLQANQKIINSKEFNESADNLSNITKERYISPVKRQQINYELRLM